MGMEGEGLIFVVYSDAIATMPGRYIDRLDRYIDRLDRYIDRLDRCIDRLDRYINR